MADDEAGASMPMIDRAGDRGAAIRSLIGCCIGMFLGASPLMLLSFGVYLLPIVKSTGWDRAVVAGSIGAPMIIAGLISPALGWLTNWFGPRRFITIGFPLGGLALMLLATPTSAVMFALTMALCGVLISGQTMMPFVYCVSGWFEERRGLALGVMLACTGLGLIFIPPIAALLIKAVGWRGTYLTFGVVVFVTGILVSRWLIVDPPVAVVADRSLVPGLPWRQALATPKFWLLFASILLVGGSVGAGTVNLHVLMVERGVGAERASLVMSLVGISMIVSRLVFGSLFDKVRAQGLTAVICIMVAAAFVVLATTREPMGVMVAAVLIGVAFGAEGDALSYMTSRAFGMRDFGTIFGVMFLAFSAGGGFGPMLFAVLRARSGDFQTSLWLAAAACGVATVLVLQIKDRDLSFAGRHRRKADDGRVAATASA